MRSLLLSISLLLLIGTGCSSKRELTIGEVANPQSESQAQEVSEEVELVNILTPEEFNEEDLPEEFKEKDIFELWDLFFQNFVTVTSESPYKSRVNYRALHKLRESKDEDFIFLVGSIEKKMASTNLAHMSIDEKAAFYINVYNYSAIRLVNKGYIKRNGDVITSLLSISMGINPLEVINRNAIALQQGIVSLKTIEENILNGIFTKESGVDARYHLALNNPSISRASLLNEAYRPEKLNQQLDTVTTEALKDSENIMLLDDDEIKLTKVFKWYREDFEKDAGTIAKFVRRYSSVQFNKVKYLNYSYDLNSLSSFSNDSDDVSVTLPSLTQGSDDHSSNTSGPCDYLISEQVKLLAYCDQVIDGDLDGFYDYEFEVQGAGICLYKREKKSKTLLGINGKLIERQIKKDEMGTTHLAIEDKVKDKDGELSFRVVEGVRTKATYKVERNTLEVRQTSIIIGRGYRKFKLQCESIE